MKTEATEQITKPKYTEFKEVLLGYIGIFLSVAITAHLLPGPLREYAYSLVLAAMVYLPVIRSEKHGQPLSAYGIHLKNWHKEIGFAAFWMLLTYPLFLLGNHFWQTMVYHRSLSFALPEKHLAMIWLEQTLFIALPEEFFYRGWMQTVFTRRWPAAFKILGGDFGKALFITSALFALGHLASIPLPFRLAVFFPSLLFCWMRAKRNSLIAPILYHGMSNVLMALINASYH